MKPTEETDLGFADATVNFDLCIDDGAAAQLFGSSGTGLAVGTATQVSCSEWVGSSKFTSGSNPATSGSGPVAPPAPVAPAPAPVNPSPIAPAQTKTTLTTVLAAAPTPTTPTGGAGTQSMWGQCGGIGYSGPTKCVSTATCKTQNAWYAQCTTA